MKTILVVDDDAHITEVICFALEKAGHAHHTASDGVEALERFEANSIDLVILDVGLPEMDGLEVCRQIRRTSQVPILFLSARSDEIDRILGLEIGGDDYVTKPFSPRELMARVGVILKRVTTPPMPEEAPAVRLQVGKLVLNGEQKSILFDGQNMNATALEFHILQAFMARPQMVFSRAQILDAAYADNLHVSDRTIDSHIRNIRAKLKKLGCANSIETVHGLGYRLGACQ